MTTRELEEEKRRIAAEARADLLRRILVEIDQTIEEMETEHRNANIKEKLVLNKPISFLVTLRNSIAAPTPCPDLHREMLTVVEDMIDSDEDRMLHGDTEEDRRVFHYGAKRLKELRIRLIALSSTLEDK